jgi:membrane protease YdiL (CAAX protease family)
VFVTLVLGVGWTVMTLPVLAEHGVIPGRSVPETLGLPPDEFAALMMIWLAILPAVLYVTWVVDGRDGVRDLVSRMLRWRFGVGWWLLVLVGIPALTLLFSVALGDQPQGVNLPVVLASEARSVLIAVVATNLIEETGWAGFVQTRLEYRHSVLVSALLAAVPFALIHMPFQFLGDFTVTSVMAGLVGYLILGSVVRTLMGLTLRGARDSLLAVGVLHAVFNSSNNDNGIAAALVEGPSRQLAALVATLVLAIAVAVLVRRRLGRRPGQFPPSPPARPGLILVPESSSGA